MKKRKWHKITAALATVAVILSSPGITDLVKGSSTEFVDIVPISEETIPASENEENISRATEDFSDTTEDFSDTTEDFFETTEEPEENFGSETAAEEGSENNEADSVDCIEDFSCEDTSNTENVSPDSASAVTVLQKADETENTELAQGEVHKAKISSSVPEGQEAAKVRLYLTDAQNETPVTDLKVTLSSGESTQEIIKDPVQLPEALNQNEPLTVTPVTEYQLDEDGDYVFDEDGNYQISAYYLEYEVPSGGSTEFEASFTYTTDAEEYDFQAKLRARMFREPEGTGEEISLNEEKNRLTLIWNSQAEQETEEDALVEVEELAAEDVGKSRPLKAGDWLFLDVNQTTSWKFDNAQVSINYGVSGYSWNSKPMTKGNDGRFRIQLTADIVGENNSFKFTLDNPKEGEKKWMPSGQDLSFTQNNDSNLYIATDDSSGYWDSGWYDPFDPNDHTFFTGKTMYFENKTGNSLDKVNAAFYEKDTEGNLQQVGQPVAMIAIQNGFSVTIPNVACSYVQFKDTSGNVLGDTYSNFYGQGAGEEKVESFLFAVGSMDCYKYAGTVENSTWGVLGERTVYYDATLSKMSYARSSDRNGGKGIPCDSNSKVYYYATKENGEDPVYGEMTPVKDSDLWSVSLSGVYTKIRFAGYEVENATTSENGAGTELVDIPGNLKNPCYFGDDSDDVIYKGGNRGGYWGEKGSLRDAESGKSSTVVDIGTSTFTRNNNTLYVDSTFYDYYTDYELNGNNRDTYTPGDQQSGSQRNYVTFRQFDQALSEYYRSNNVSITIYTGHFQPDYSGWGNPFSNIADTLNLYGYDRSNQNGFMSTNNSTLNADGKGTYYDSAAQGLVSDRLNSGNLMEKGGTAQEPHFDESFLTGTNSKNTVLGKVYHNVSFPFTKQKLDINGNKCNDNNTPNVDYWYFDSADTTLAMRKDSASGEYYLQDTGKQDWSKNVNSSSSDQNTHGFFPFNETAKACSAGNYNYGFGTKLEFKFRLTDDGKVTASDGKTEFPIQFTFSGDDDVWVYVDGNLALDVGGAHGKVTGKIDFSGNSTQKSATVSKTKVSQGSRVEGTDIHSTFELSGSNTDEHTLTMFYMERGMWESNMKVTFNFPDENQLQVEKQVDTTDVNELFKGLFEGTDLFNFTIKNLATHYGAKATASTGFVTKQYDIADYGSAESGKLENPTGAVYTSSAKSGAYAIDENGTFVLQDKETITFRDQFRRGSYIYLKEEVDPNLFDTTWTMFENGQLVTSMGTGGTVTNGSVSDFNKMEKRLSVNDGRTEVYKDGKDTEGQTIDNAYKGKKPSEDTFVFRSYAEPDDTTTLTKLKAVFYNKVKTGSLTIRKEAAYPTDQLNGTYKFKLTFTNVGGAGLETAPIEVPEISLNANESYTIRGIPIGTSFTIEEITPTDGSTLNSILLNEVPQEAGTTVLHGDINATKPEAVAVFKNTKKPKVKTSIQILKIKAGTSGENQVELPGADFKLEKLTADETITVKTVTTDKLGLAKFENLEDGTYQITETKAPDGYNLLKSPIKVEINRSDNSIKVDGRTDVFDKISDNTIEIQVANQAKFQLPATGSWSRLILGFTGAIIAGTAVIMYLLLQKRRKEGKTS